MTRNDSRPHRHMRLFVYEHLMAGAAGVLPASSLLAEGRAMLLAVVEDLAAAGHDVVTLLSTSAASQVALPAEVVTAGDQAARIIAFERLARDTDGTLVIAPEIGGALAGYRHAVDEVQGCWLGSSLDAIGVASDKHRMAETLRSAGVPAPEGILISAGDAVPDGFPFPAVVKPCDGAGSQDVLLLRARPDAADWPRRSTPRRLERFCPGLATSVALLVGPGGTWALPPCAQHLSDDGRFAYLGGSTPIEPALAARAERLARRAVAVLPGLQGYVGVDMVLGADSAGGDDVVIEVNPRFTTSYLGLRRLAADNLAAALLEVVAGRIPRLCFGSQLVRFAAD